MELYNIPEHESTHPPQQPLQRSNGTSTSNSSNNHNQPGSSRSNSSNNTTDRRNNNHPHLVHTPHITHPHVRDGSIAGSSTLTGSDVGGAAGGPRPSLQDIYGSKSSLLSRRVHKVPKYNTQQIKTISSFSSLNYAPTHSHVYKVWKKHNAGGVGMRRWFLMILSAFLIGCIGCLINQSLQFLDKFKWDTSREYIQEHGIWVCWGWTAGISAVLVMVASFLVTFLYPEAVGSGVPEVLSYLNGVVVHRTLNIMNLIVKFFALILAVGSGLPCAIQGPLIAMGAIIGHGVGQFKSKSLRFSPGIFSHFRNPEDRRAFTTAGVAAGVAAGFNAPIGGLMFAMEDLATFWNRRLCWQTLFCAGIAASTANLVNSAYNGFEWTNDFGLFSLSVIEPITLGSAIFIPAIAIGVFGGLLGGVFNHLNYRICYTRKKLVAKISSPAMQKIVRILEPTLLAIGMASSVIFISNHYDCKSLTEVTNVTGANVLQHCGVGNPVVVEPFNCPGNENYTEYYSEMATLTMGSGRATLDKLHSRNTHHWFDYTVLLTLFPIYYVGTCWTAGTAIAGGVFVPLLVTGSILGRVVGMGVLDLLKYHSGNDVPVIEFWRWVDPGVISILGAGAMFGGVTRLTVAGTVIIVELTRDIHITVPLMLTIFIAKEVAHVFSKPLYAYQLQLKALPYLEYEVNLHIDDKKVDLELYTASDVMKTNVRTIRLIESVSALSRLLLDTNHGGFPVIQNDPDSGVDLAYGLITSTELSVILYTKEIEEESQIGKVITPDIGYEEVSVDYLTDQRAIEERLRKYIENHKYNNIFINLEPFVNLSAPKVDCSYSLHRTYSLFRTLGLRHLMVIDLKNRIKGIITRKDLLPFNMAEKLVKADDDDIESDIPAISASGGYNPWSPDDSSATGGHTSGLVPRTDTWEQENLDEGVVNLQTSPGWYQHQLHAASTAALAPTPAKRHPRSGRRTPGGSGAGGTDTGGHQSGSAGIGTTSNQLQHHHRNSSDSSRSTGPRIHAARQNNSSSEL